MRLDRTTWARTNETSWTDTCQSITAAPHDPSDAGITAISCHERNDRRTPVLHHHQLHCQWQFSTTGSCQALHLRVLAPTACERRTSNRVHWGPGQGFPPPHPRRHFEQRVRMQVGNLPLAGTAPVAPTTTQHTLQLVSDEALQDAQAWVRKWPEARGATCLLPALTLSRDTWGHTDDVYLFSDGIIDDAAAVLAFIDAAKRDGGIDASGEAAARWDGGFLGVPRIHCIGFFASTASAGGGHRGEEFLRALAVATGGTFRSHGGADAPPAMLKDGEFVPVDMGAEAPEVTRERQWIEARLSTERAALARAEKCVPFQKVLSDVKAAWKLERRGPAAAAAAKEAAEVAAVNDAAQRAWEEATAGVRAAAEAAHAAAVQGVPPALALSLSPAVLCSCLPRSLSLSPSTSHLLPALAARSISGVDWACVAAIDVVRATSIVAVRTSYNEWI